MKSLCVLWAKFFLKLIILFMFCNCISMTADERYSFFIYWHLSYNSEKKVKHLKKWKVSYTIKVTAQ